MPVPQTRHYLRIEGEARQLVDERLICGMPVHVAVPDRGTGVAVSNRIRGWLPALLAMSANSPSWEGRDTGFASWRTIVFGRWPVSGPPPAFNGFADCERRLEAFLSSRMTTDRGQVYWHARLSDRYPTVEVRCLDVQPRDDAPELDQAANWHAARHGLNGRLEDAGDLLQEGIPADRQRRALTDDGLSGLLGLLTGTLTSA